MRECSRTDQHVCTGTAGDKCISAKSNWKGYTCATAKGYCTSQKWKAEVKQCCPVTCTPVVGKDGEERGERIVVRVGCKERSVQRS